MKTIKKELENLYKIKLYNIVCVTLICLCLLFLEKFSKVIFQEIFNIHIGLNLKIDFLTIYSGFLALILPVAILIIERIEDKDNAIISEAYLKYTRIFPVVVYFVFNLLIFTFDKDQYYFIITSIISTIMIIYMYYKSFKMISDLVYEKKKINEVQEDIIAKDLIEQTNHFSDKNLISNYKKYGIMINKYDYLSTSNFKKINIYPEKEYLIIEQYNYKLLNKIIKKLKEINYEYVTSVESNNSNDELQNEKKLNIVIMLSDIGSSSDKNRSWITLYYNEKTEKDIREITKLLSDKIYITSEANNHLYIEKAYEAIQKECVESLNSMSSTLLTRSLNKYLDIYKNYINEISDKIGDYSYEVSYTQVNSFYRIRAYDFLNNIQKNIYDYCEMITETGNSKMMNSLIGFLYDMILYSYSKRELLSIQHLYNTYSYLSECSLRLKNDTSFNKIKIEIFEFMRILKYDYNNVDKNFVHDALLICNKTLGNIIFNLSINDKEKLYKYYNKLMNFINDIKEDMEQVNPFYNEKTNDYYNILNDIYKNFICNIFAITSYIIHNSELTNEEVTQLLQCYKQFDYDDLTKILTDTIDLDYNSKMYSWDLMEMNKMDEDGVYSINTISYLIHFYCLLITRISVKTIKIKSNYQLSIQANNIINELKSINKTEYISIFEKVIEDVKNEEKEYIRNTPISKSKVDKFKTKFIENYSKYNKLLLLFKETENLKYVQRKKKGVNFLVIRNIVDKTYFLNETPNNRCIIWSNFEDGYANSFINSEEKKVALSLSKKSVYIDEKIMDYLNGLTKSQLKKSILFSNYESIYNIIGYSDIKYNNESESNDYANLFIVIKKEYIPVVIIDGLEDEYIYHVYKKQLGKLEKYIDEFRIEVSDFYNNEKLLNKTMEENINGLDLEGEARKNHLLESVDLLLEEYFLYDDEKLISQKFDK